MTLPPLLLLNKGENQSQLGGWTSQPQGAPRQSGLIPGKVIWGRHGHHPCRLTAPLKVLQVLCPTKKRGARGSQAVPASPEGPSTCCLPQGSGRRQGAGAVATGSWPAPRPVPSTTVQGGGRSTAPPPTSTVTCGNFSLPGKVDSLHINCGGRTLSGVLSGLEIYKPNRVAEVPPTKANIDGAGSVRKVKEWA